MILPSGGSGRSVDPWIVFTRDMVRVGVTPILRTARRDDYNNPSKAVNVSLAECVVVNKLNSVFCYHHDVS
jgi:hypothetical protein